MSAHLRGVVDAEKAAFLKLAESDDPDASAGALNVGSLLADIGDLDGARAAFQMAIDSGHPYDAPAAAVCLGDLLAEHHDDDGARLAYQIAIDSSNREEADRATEKLQRLRRTPRESRRRWR
jgi:predicted negative regulator of RcsB-dependent stress response